MKLLSVKDVAIKWNLSERSVRNYCKENRVFGAVLKGKKWFIPADATPPIKKINRIVFNNILKCLKLEKQSKFKGGLYHQTQIDFAYNSNHIEGSKLTKDQTRYIFETNTIGLEENKTINIDDVIETLNHFRCFDYLLDTINETLDHKIIKTLHKILKTNTSSSRLEWFKVGDYKAKPNYVGEAKTSLPENVYKDIDNLLVWYNSIKTMKFEDILQLHVLFEKIHPFQDGNGRVGRLIMFRECLRHNIVPFIIKDDVRLFYYRGLKQWNKLKGYLTDTCLKCQDDFKQILKYFKIKY